MTGVLVVDKPEGSTSHDLVLLARRALGERRVGHCGTLDPMATGVLVLAVGPVTRLVRYLSADDKEYVARVRFGESTDTHDRTGAVTARTPARPSIDAVAAALGRFRGARLQVPPVFSAKKLGGQRAYALARQGAEVASRLAPVAVSVHALEMTAFDGDEATLALRVSSGYYVRALVRDLGEAVGCGAVMTSLRRTASGPFRTDEALAAGELAGGDRGRLEARLVPPGRLLLHLPAVTLDRAAAGRARHGRDLETAAGVAASPATRLIDEHGDLVGIATPSVRPGFLHPSVILG